MFSLTWKTEKELQWRQISLEDKHSDHQSEHERQWKKKKRTGAPTTSPP